MGKEKKIGPGGKLGRSEIIQARLSPQVRLKAEILAFKEKLTLSSLIENKLAEAAENTTVFIWDRHQGKRVERNLAQFVDEIWEYNEPKRFVAQALHIPESLTNKQIKVWQRICNSCYFWRCMKTKYQDQNGNELFSSWEPLLLLDTLIEPNLNQYWELLNDLKADESQFPPAHERVESIEPDGGGSRVCTINMNTDITTLEPYERLIFFSEFGVIAERDARFMLAADDELQRIEEQAGRELLEKIIETR